MPRRIGRRRIGVVLGLLLTLGTSPALAQDSQGQQAILNAVESEQEPGQPAFNVTAFATVVDAENVPITGLSADDFSLSEDGNAVELLAASPATQVANIVLVLDTSGSMAAQGKMDAVKEAAASFVVNLAAEDRVSIVAFNENIEILQDLSDDHVASASIIDLIDVAPATGTCLYDAANIAVVKATTAPPGRRAVILLTDGVDELPDAPGVPCSQRTLEEMIEFASGGTTRSPIYTIGVGSDVNAEELSQIAADTGGTAVLAAGADDVASLFDLISEQLKSQYALAYQSTAPSGQHGLTLSVTLDGTVIEDQLNFILPEPTLLNVVGLADGDELAVDDMIATEAALTGPLEALEVAFALDGESISVQSQPPFIFDLDAGRLEPGAHTLTVDASMEDGQRLNRSIRFSVMAPVIADEPEEADTQPAPAPASGRPNPLAIGSVVGIVVAVAIALVVALARQRMSATIIGGASGYSGPEDLTHTIAMAEVLAVLTVRQSQRLLPGQPFDLSNAAISLGRGANNDIVVPDEPVSQSHAEIRPQGGEFFVFDKGSEFGTAVNSQLADEQGLLLSNGDELVLAVSSHDPTRFAFNIIPPSPPDEPEDTEIDVLLDDTISANMASDADSQQPDNPQD